MHAPALQVSGVFSHPLVTKFRVEAPKKGTTPKLKISKLTYCQTETDIQGQLTLLSSDLALF